MVLHFWMKQHNPIICKPGHLSEPPGDIPVLAEGDDSTEDDREEDDDEEDDARCEREAEARAEDEGGWICARL